MRALIASFVCCLLAGVANADLSSMSSRMPSISGVNPSTLPDKGNCSLTDPTQTCDSILDTWTGESGANSGEVGAGKKLKKMQAGLLEGNQTTADVEKMCAMGEYFRTCMESTVTSCGGSKSKNKMSSKGKTNPLVNKGLTGRFCKGGYINPNFKKLMQESNLVTCMSSTDGRKLKQTMQKMSGKMETKTARVSEADMSGAGTGSTDAKMKLQRSKSACGAIRASMNRMMMWFRKNSALGCNDAAKKMMVQKVMMSMPPGLASQCKLPNATASGALNNKANRKDSKRQTIAMYGLSHMRVFNQTDSTITCEDYDTSANITLLEHDFLEITGELAPYNSSTNATMLKSVFIKFRDSKYAELDGISMKADNRGSLPQKMDGNRQSIGEGTQSGGGKVEGKIAMERKSEDHMLVRDQNSGMYLSVRKYNVKGTKPVYSIVGRLPESMLENAGGRLVEGCTQNQDIQTKLGLSGRRKRSTTSTEGTYDSTVTGDPNASQMATNALSDISSASTSDSTFNSGPRVAVSSAIVLLLAVITAVVLP